MLPSVQKYKAINSDGIHPAHAQFVVVVSKHYLLKALIQLLRNIEDHATAHFTLCFAFFFILQSILYRESLQNCFYVSNYRRKA